MVINKENFDTKKFNKSLKKFFNNSPLLLSYNIGAGGVTIFLHENLNSESYKEIISYTFDYGKSIEDNIHEIKKKLQKYYPRMIQVKEENVEASTSELNDLMAKGEISLNDVTNIGYLKKEETIWIVDKVFLEKDEILIRKEYESKTYKYKLKYPVLIFLKKLRNEDMNKYEAWNFFENKAVIEDKNK